jgi:D-beta-D-heptose 7-phosphate kinase / D-beta-D-heptose 1-phosphate adenosyltransferase
MKTDYLSILKKFRKYKILIIGDFIMDVYLQGNCTRLAPEASVPVVDIVSKKSYLGGAANAAANLSAMGCKVLFCTVTGKDAVSESAMQLLEGAGISSALVVQAKERHTIVKTRVTAPSHTLLRYDEGTDTPMIAETEARLICNLKQAYQECDAVLVADYDKGTVSQTVIAELKKLKLQQDKFIAVDSKRAEVFACLKPSLIKPNYDEAIRLLALSYSKESRVEQLKPFGKLLQERTNAAVIALTMDKDGALFFEQGEFTHRCYAQQINNPNVSGAGDTFISACILALLSDCDIPVAAEIATAAAGVAIAKLDTSICHDYELAGSLTAEEKSIFTMSVLKQKCKLYKAEGKRLVFTNGCFDILHSGHVNYLRRAKEMGDILIVGLNNDDSIKRLKGANRPVNTLENRIEVLSALGCVDHVVPFGSLKDDTPVSLIKVIHPDVFVKGGDYKGKYLAEEKLLRRMGCSIEFLPFIFNQSTTKIINRIENRTILKIAIAN